MITLSHMIEETWKIYIEGGSRNKKLYRLHQQLLDTRHEINKALEKKDKKRLEEAVFSFLR